MDFVALKIQHMPIAGQWNDDGSGQGWWWQDKEEGDGDGDGDAEAHADGHLIDGILKGADSAGHVVRDDPVEGTGGEGWKVFMIRLW